MWVRRLVIWRDPQTIIQNIHLRSGLNIVWSPGGTDGDSPIGHGGGKSTFCRLLRFCLAEDTFGPDTLRQRIGEVFPKGHVGAEVILDGTLWIVVRALGIRRRDFVQEGGRLEDAFSKDARPTGIGPLADAISHSVLGPSAALVPRSIGSEGAWKALLAWMTRDQECRFAHPLDWRSSNSDSRSPVVNRSAEDKLLIVRAAIKALSKSEIDAQAQEEKQRDELSKQKSLISHLEWQMGRVRRDLRSALRDRQTVSHGTSGTPIDTILWKKAAEEQLAKALNLPGRVGPDEVHLARRNRESAKSELDRLNAELTSLKSEITSKEETQRFLRSELPQAYARLNDGIPVCPICKVPIDKAKAEGCGISLETCDVHKLQAELAQKNSRVAELGLAISRLRQQEPALSRAVASAEQRLEAANKVVQEIEKSLDESSKTIRTARRLREDVDGYELLIGELDQARLKEKKIELELNKTGENVAKFRESSSHTVARLSTFFDLVLHELLPGEVHGTAKIDGNGLKLNIKWGGDRSTAAIDSLKVVIFDLAVLVMSMEKSLFLPGILVHDSPREADLSEEIYKRLFAFANKLEKCGPAPLFQYILTTTTAPPELFRTEPWLRLEVKGAPAKERLLKVDL